MRIVRSAYANAVLRSVNVAAALAAPGIVAVWTAADIADLPPIDFRDPAAEALRPYRQPLLARERLRYVGEPIAAVFAPDPYLAEDAAELVSVEADELAPTLDASAAPGSFASGLSTEALLLSAGYGEVEAAFAAAHGIAALDLTIGRHSAVPMETRGVLARFDAAADVLELYGAAKVPHRNRDGLARMLGRSTTAVVLREGNTGGEFGVRGELYPRIFLSASPPCDCDGRSNGSRTGASIWWPPTTRASSAIMRAPRSTRTVGFWLWKTHSSSTKAPMCARMAPGWRR
jgi:carbon-monoxide dehydrogenase large subunit/6-hydroxypseudooxynicotine dehydrogenase subunit gamma